jgi:dolichol-phosphate mannosyltransferase
VEALVNATPLIATRRVLQNTHLAIVCPMANESDSAVEFVQQILTYCSEFRKVDFLVILDRASKDNTFELMSQYAVVESRLSPIWAPENTCVVDAYRRGYEGAIGSGADWILEIDGGFSHRPADLPRFFSTMAIGFDCVFATRFAKGGKIVGSSWKRALISRGGTFLSNLILSTKLSDMTSGFQLFRRDVLERILQKGIVSRGPFFQTEMKAYCQGLHVAEVPITYSMASHAVGMASLRESLVQLKRLYRLKNKDMLTITAEGSGAGDPRFSHAQSKPFGWSHKLLIIRALSVWGSISEVRNRRRDIL